MAPTVLVLTVVVPLRFEHDHDTHTPNVFRMKVDLAAEKPSQLEAAALFCVQNNVAVLHLQHKEKPYEVSAYETFASQIKQAAEDLAEAEEESDPESEEDDFDDEPSSKKVKKEGSSAPAASAPIETPVVRRIDAKHLTTSIARRDDGNYRKVKPLTLTEEERSLVLLWEPANEDHE